MERQSRSRQSRSSRSSRSPSLLQHEIWVNDHKMVIWASKPLTNQSIMAALKRHMYGRNAKNVWERAPGGTKVEYIDYVRISKITGLPKYIIAPLKRSTFFQTFQDRFDERLSLLQPEMLYKQGQLKPYSISSSMLSQVLRSKGMDSTAAAATAARLTGRTPIKGGAKRRRSISR